ncbi:MAG: lipopolysaccharide heptosyltransferase family protein [Planctomycetota bacterium]|nr:MAG: lipopolysaccharide heptosyltransferase family protein [Planctomycetota bacterium]
MRSLLIVRLSALGDAIHVLPALRALRETHPSAKIGWAIEDRAASLLRGQPDLDRVHVVPRKQWTAWLRGGSWRRFLAGARGLMSELRRERYEVALDFQSNLRSSLVALLSGAPRRIGQPRPYAKEGSGLWFTERPDPVPTEAHKIVRNLALLEPLGVRPASPPRGRLALPEAPSLRAALAAGRRPRAVLHAGVSAFGALKAWREERFARLGAALAGDGCEVLFAWGGARERAQAERLAAAAPGARVAPATASLLELAVLLGESDLFVGVDSGPLHLAAMLGTPVLGLYGPKHPGTYGPFWPEGRVVRADEPCSPCRHRRCPRPDAAWQEAGGARLRISPCMDALSVEAALAAARELLARALPSEGPPSSA